jgi:ribulose-5-phosphate 4-epimerase/fuculose-1-phosphate aldolase
MSDEIESTKREVAIANRILAEVGLASGVRASLGHASMRLPSNPDLFLVKGRGYRSDIISRMRPEEMVTCDLEGNWVDGPAGSTQCHEIKMHSCIYKLRPDVQSVVHVHPKYTTIMSTLQRPLVPIVQEGANLVNNPLPIYPHTKTVTTEREGQEVAKLLGSGKAVLLLGHGAATAGVSLQDSIMTMILLEHQAEMNYHALCAAGPDYPRIPNELIEEMERLRGLDEPHMEARAKDPSVRRREGNAVYNYLCDLVGRDM